MKLTHYLVLAAAALSFGACNSGGTDATAQYADIVTLESTNEQGSVMTFQVLDDSPLVTLTTAQSFSKDQVGKRIIVIYSPINTTEHGKSDVVKIINANPTFGGGAAPVPAVADTLNNWASEQIDYMQVFRAGKYLNMAMSLNTTKWPKKFQCYVDVTTLDNDYPELQVVYESETGYDSYSYYYFASYDISGIWNRPNVKGLKVIYSGSPNNLTIIEKSPGEQIKPAE